MTAAPLTGEQGHFVPSLTAAGVGCRSLPLTLDAAAPADLPAALRRRLERHVGWPCLAGLLDALRRDPPDVLHCWLDFANVVGALAGIVAGVPRIVVSVRALNPSHFPDLNLPWLRASYRWLSRCPEVSFVANSLAGARDYAAWIGIREERFQVVHNGVPLPSPPGPEERLAQRRALGVPDGAFLVVGVLRLSAEKRPGDFVAALRAARARVPHLRAVHVGAGPLEEETRRAAGALEGALTLVGRRSDPERWLRGADACRLTSALEGCPNVLLEAQALGVPVVTTRAGGAPETVAAGETGLLAEVGAVDELAAHLQRLAADPAGARAMGEAGRRLMAERFSVDAMVRRTLALHA
jgi:glycosyltransferase involved in cell wall biosynthesis